MELDEALRLYELNKDSELTVHGKISREKIDQALHCLQKFPMHVFSSPEPKAQGELIVYSCSGVRPSYIVHNFKLKYLRNQWANCNKILSEPSFGWGKGCIRFWARSDRNSGVHGNG